MSVFWSTMKRQVEPPGVLGQHRHADEPPAVVMRKAIISGVTFSAAAMKSPSFSRSSSSTTITMRPSARAATASSTFENSAAIAPGLRLVRVAAVADIVDGRTRGCPLSRPSPREFGFSAVRRFFLLAKRRRRMSECMTRHSSDRVRRRSPRGAADGGPPCPSRRSPS